MVTSFEKNTKKTPFGNRQANVRTVTAIEATSSLDDWGEVERGNSIEVGAEIPAPKQPVTVLETVDWLIKILGVSPLPNCPAKAVEFAKPPKAPNYILFDGCVAAVNWKDWQLVRPPEALRKRWWNNKNIQHTGVGAIAGLNHNNHYIEFIDIDAKHFDSQEECDRIVQEWEDKFPVLKQCPVFRSPGGGYRYIIALSQKDEIFACIGAFNFEPDQEESIGEIIHNNGGHSLFPPSVREDGKAYYWERWVNYPPVVNSYGEIGLFPKLKVKDKKTASTNPKHSVETQVKTEGQTGETNKDDQFSQLIADIQNNLELEQAFNWTRHNFSYDGEKLKGNCPWHDSSSGTSFYAEKKNGKLLWRCAGCDQGGNVFDYRHSLNVGSILKPKGKEFIGVLRELAGEAGLDCSFLDKKKKAKNTTQIVGFVAPKDGLDPEVAFTQIAYNTLYGNAILAYAMGKMYKWNATHYIELNEETERKKIAKFCNNYLVVKGEGENAYPTYPYANPGAVSLVWGWVKELNGVDPKQLQTKGINFKNGVLTIDWDDRKPIINFEKHDPDKHYFTSEPQIEYNPLADNTSCNQLLSCLDPNQRQILLRNLAASLDILTVRKHHGRKIKLLLCIGGGSNGKDSIREVVSLIFGGKGMTSFSLDDFIDYDRGIKNSLAGLELSRVNWASESNKTTRLDNSKSLKSFATGDTLIARYLHKDGVPFIPQSVGLFNLNELPNLYGTSQAAMDRFAPITFEKTFVTIDKYDPANKNHMIADPKFKYDPQFIIKDVAPAFVNILIQELHNLMEFGIDYSCTENKLDQIQKDNNHLFDFCESVRLEYQENAIISISELWQHLEKYYTDQEILTLDNSGNRRWADPVKPSDKYVKGANQVYDRLQAIFPNISSHSMRLNGATKPTKFIKGISIQFDKPNQNTIPARSYTPVDTPVIPQFNPSLTPVEKISNQDTASDLPSSYTPYTPVSNNSSEKNKLLDQPTNLAADDSNVSINKETYAKTGVYGDNQGGETVTTTETEPDHNWGITGVSVEETGVKVGYKPEDVVEDSTNVKPVQFNTPANPAPTADTTPPDWISNIVVGDVDSIPEQKRREREQEQREYDQELESLKVKVHAAKTLEEHDHLLNYALSQSQKLVWAIRAFLGKLPDVSEDVLKVWEWSYR